MCRSRLWLLYWVSTQIFLRLEFARLDSAKSTRRYTPPNGTAGFARSSVSGASRVPAPPASTIPRTRGSALMPVPPVLDPEANAAPSSSPGEPRHAVKDLKLRANKPGHPERVRVPPRPRTARPFRDPPAEPSTIERRSDKLL